MSITIYPSRTVITDVSDRSITAIERNLSVFNKITFTVDFEAFMKDNNQIVIPRGYDLDSLTNIIDTDQDIIDNSHLYNPYHSIDFKPTTKPREKIQQEAINFLSGKEKFEYTKDYTQKLLSLATGKGKTFCMINYITIAKKLPMVIVDQDHIIKQWYNEFLNHTDIKPEEIYFISGRDSIDKLIKAKNSNLPFKAYIASHKTLSAFCKTPELADKLFKYLQIGIKVFDEAHTSWANMNFLDLNTNVSETVYLTATPSRSNASENLVFQKMFSGMPHYGLEKKFVDEKYHKVVYVSYNTHPSSSTEASMVSRRGFDTKKWSEYILNECYDQFYEMIYNSILDKLLTSRPNTRIAIILHKNDIVQRLANDLKNELPNKSIGIFTSLTKKNKSDELLKDIIISTEKSLNKAIDIRGLEVVINTVPLSSAVVTEQMIGRLRKEGDKPCIYFDLTDVGFSSCKKQLSYRKKVLNQKAKSISQMNI